MTTRGLKTGSVLHHVRLLVETGFLPAEEPRKGARNAKEIPYRATRLTWHGSLMAFLHPDASQLQVQPQRVVEPDEE